MEVMIARARDDVGDLVVADEAQQLGALRRITVPTVEAEAGILHTREGQAREIDAEGKERKAVRPNLPSRIRCEKDVLEPLLLSWPQHRAARRIVSRVGDC